MAEILKVLVGPSTTTSVFVNRTCLCVSARGLRFATGLVVNAEICNELLVSLQALQTYTRMAVPDARMGIRLTSISEMGGRQSCEPGRLRKGPVWLVDTPRKVKRDP